MTFIQAALAGRRKLSSPLFWSLVGYYTLALLIFTMLVMSPRKAHGAEVPIPMPFNKVDPADPFAIPTGDEPAGLTIIRCAPIDPSDVTLLSDGSGYLVKMWGEVLPLDLAKPAVDDTSSLCAVRGTGADKTWVPVSLFLPSVRGL